MGIVKNLKTFKNFLKYREKLMVVESLRNYAIGMNSYVDLENDVHILMLDYDIDDLDKVRESVREIQMFFKLSDAHIYKTLNGYHAIFYYDHMPFTRTKLIIDYAKYVDPMYKHISRYHDHKTLRVMGKHKGDIKFDRIIPGVRPSTDEEFEIGKLKRSEHSILMNKSINIRKKT